MEYEATYLGDNRYAVRPKGALGTCGWIANTPWDVQYIKAAHASKALHKAEIEREARAQAKISSVKA